jgi:protein tyrosine phosphatase (PTP) superfamily phosphohydrolase (DUF442 family)
MATTLDEAPRRRFRLKPRLRGCAVGVLLVVIGIVIYDTLLGNFHTVIPGRVYRSAQLSPDELEKVCRERDIRTVVNLRGNCAPQDWYLDECRAVQRMNIAQIDISLSAMRLPSTAEVRRLVEVLDSCEYPILFHCFRGADRTGLAGTMARLLQDGVTLKEAVKQLGIYYGHVRIGRTYHIDHFFELYGEWLKDQGIAHSPDVFRRWALTDYCPGECRAELELPRAPTYLLRGKSEALALHVRNTSIKTWRLRPETNAGIHAMFTLFDEHGATIYEGRAGLFHAEVPPGATIDLTLALPPIAKPGKVRLVIDMVDEQHCGFSQAGSESLELELEVREQEAATGG